MNWLSRARSGIIVPCLLLTLVVVAVIFFTMRVHKQPARAEKQSTPPPQVGKPLVEGFSAVPSATDWPQWRGPRRDGVSLEPGKLRDWPAGGPALLWTYEYTGEGYSAPAIVSGTTFVLVARGDTEYVIALDARTGTPQGEVALGPAYVNDWGSGPRGTLAVDGDRLYAITGRGDLACVHIPTGRVVWRTNLYTAFEGTLPTWGCGESPLVDGDQVVCTPGGAKGTVLALHKLTGVPLWRSKDFTDACGYSSLVPAEIAGVRQYVQMTFESVAGVAADDGRLLWRFPRVGNNAPVPTPIVAGNLVYATSGYGAGCHLIRVTADAGRFSAEQVYASKAMSNHHGGVVKVGDHLYGYADHKGWICQHLPTGRVIWSEKRALGKGCLIAVGDRLVCYDEKDGRVCLVEASPRGWKEHGRFSIPRQSALPRKEGGIWTHPVIADGRLYLRDQELLFCFNIASPYHQRFSSGSAPR